MLFPPAAVVLAPVSAALGASAIAYKVGHKAATVGKDLAKK